MTPEEILAAALEGLEEPAALEADTTGRITVDGDLYDWTMVPGMTHSDPHFSQWKVARDLDGNVYLCSSGTAQTPYDDYAIVHKPVVITQGGQQSSVTLGSLLDTIAGAELTTVNLANGQTPGPLYIELMIPAGYFTDPNFTIGLNWNGATVPAASIPVLNGVEVPPPEPPKYEGIEIDGKFSDWDAVEKVPIRDTNPTQNNLESAAFVFDGDLYIYLKEAPGGDACTAGSHSTGNYAITTDLGRVLKFQLKQDGSVYGVAGATARHTGREWEICIPKSALPYYLETVDFGLYLEDPTFSGVSNMDGSGGNAGSFDGITIDGRYDDWVTYKHAVIEYSTQGTQEEQTDSQGALYLEDGVLYGHVMTTMPNHLDSMGGDFLANITIAFNHDRDYKSFIEEGNFYPCMLDENGAVVNEFTRLEHGIHTFRICDLRTLGDGGGPQIFGTMKVTVDPNRQCDEMEFELDLEALAQRQNCDVSDYKVIEGSFGRFGGWITIAGASSGAYLGVAVSCGAVAGVLFWRKKRGAAA